MTCVKRSIGKVFPAYGMKNTPGLEVRTTIFLWHGVEHSVHEMWGVRSTSTVQGFPDNACQ